MLGDALRQLAFLGELLRSTGDMGKVGTFYSDRDGVGRSMALASVAWLLATNGERVVVVDWDLQKPSLHNYLTPFLSDADWRATPGVIDFLWDYARSARRASAIEREALLQNAPAITVCHCTLPVDHHSPPRGELDLILAGALRTRVIRERYFSWRELFDRLSGHGFLESLFRKLVDRYDYVLIDLPSGTLTDAASFPALRSDVLIPCCTLDFESISKTAEAARLINDRIRGRQCRVLPLLMRVERAEMSFLQEARTRARKAFEWLESLPTDEAAEDRHCVEVPQIPYYTYQRVLPTVIGHDLAEEYLRFTSRLTSRSDLQWHPSSEDRIHEYQEHIRTGSHFDNDDRLDKPPPRPYQGEDSYTFVSYARDERDRMLSVVQDLAQLGFKLWWDEEITGGSEWRAYLESKIRRSQHMLLFLSRQSMSSKNVQEEIQIALELNKPLLSVRLDWTDLTLQSASSVSTYQILDNNSFSFAEDLFKAMLFLNPSQCVT